MLVALVAGTPVAAATMFRVFRVERPDQDTKNMAAVWAENRDVRAENKGLRVEIGDLHDELSVCERERRKFELQVLSLGSVNEQLRAALDRCLEKVP